jgi:hypothetical protein
MAVDGVHQIIIALHVQTTSADGRALGPLLTAARTVLCANPCEVSADASFCDQANLAWLAHQRINAFLAPGRPRHGERHAGGGAAAMAPRLAYRRHGNQTPVIARAIEPPQPYVVRNDFAEPEGSWRVRRAIASALRMEPSITMATTDFPIYESNAEENEWQEAP